MDLLIVDGNVQDQQWLEAILKKEGHHTKTARHGEVALTFLKNEHFDGIISEVALPGGDGFCLLRTITQDDALKKIPFLFFTNTLNEEDISFIRMLGAEIIWKSQVETASTLIKALKTPKSFTVLDEHTYLQKYSALLQKMLENKVKEIEEIQKKLSQSEMKYQKLFEGSHDATFIMNIEGGHIEANKEASELLGYTLEEFRKLSFREIVVPSAVPDSEQKLEMMLRGENIPIYEKDFRTKDGRIVPVEVSVSSIQDESGNVAYIQSIVRDITERKKAEQALRESEEKYRNLVEQANDGIAIIREGLLKYVNPWWVETTGYTAEELINTPVTDYVFSDRLPDVLDHTHTGRDITPLYKGVLTCKKRRMLHIEFNAGVTTYQGDPAILMIMRDVTERKKAEEALLKSEKQYRDLFENAPIGIYRTTPDGRMLVANPALIHMLGYSSFEELAQYNLDEEASKTGYPRSEFKERIEREGKVTGFESGQTIKDGTVMFFRESAQAVLDSSGTIIYYEGTVEDITESKMAEEQIKRSLKEKEVLLREIHHRVKNNMQIISSLLSLQSQYTEDDQLREAFKDSQNRIQSMAIVHEKLYQSEDFASIDFKEYVESLTRSLFQSSRIDIGRITLKVEVGDVPLGSDYVIPCGLIINELISNCLKHAFPGNKKGEITIKLNRCNEKEIELVVADNGVGMPGNIDIENTKSLGLRLVTILAEDQLRGRIRLDRTGGTEVSIIFEVN
jgi:PAS domain S-box-containing protein